MYENEKIPIKESSYIKWIGEFLETNLDGVEDINDKYSDEQVNINTSFDATRNIKITKLTRKKYYHFHL